MGAPVGRPATLCTGQMTDGRWAYASDARPPRIAIVAIARLIFILRLPRTSLLPTSLPNFELAVQTCEWYLLPNLAIRVQG